ncbi:FAD:protein FMN transferase [Jeotgalibaca sp. PTS2502]|uniref:FAD:protein FMN transferase n=1 Tax=Jeotgalibaca sp. PTS2502 TaxID=1903686 RepID=UPI0009FA85C4|nr:FAD:protein FMN transferase [Jeotgalibaca sp. PTS2502]
MIQKKERIHMMGTVIDLLIEHDNPDPIMADTIERLRVYEHRFSANRHDSELMAINHQAGQRPVVVHPQLYDLIKIGKYHSCADDSHLNIAIGPLIQTWRIGFQDAKVPSQAEIDELLRLTNPHHIILDDQEQTVFLKESGMKIDLGCLAKGYMADLLVDFLKTTGVTAALINLGGNVVGLGPVRQGQAEKWRIGIQDPQKNRNDYVTVLDIANQSVVTSGIYERSLKKDNQTYHHIFNPKTGYPTQTDVASLTIRSKQSIDGEIWTTRLYGHQSETIIDTLNQLDDIDGIVITQNGHVLYSK